MKSQYTLKGKILSQLIFLAQLTYFSILTDKNFNIASALFKEPKYVSFRLILSITLNSSMAITPLSPGQCLFSTF